MRWHSAWQVPCKLLSVPYDEVNITHAEAVTELIHLMDVTVESYRAFHCVAWDLSQDNLLSVYPQPEGPLRYFGVKCLLDK